MFVGILWLVPNGFKGVTWQTKQLEGHLDPRANTQKLLQLSPIPASRARLDPRANTQKLLQLSPI